MEAIWKCRFDWMPRSTPRTPIAPSKVARDPLHGDCPVIERRNFGSIPVVIIGLLALFVFMKEAISEPSHSVSRLELIQYPNGDFCFTNEEWRGFYAINFMASQTTYALECDKFFADTSEPTKGRFSNKSQAIQKKYEKFFERYISKLNNFIVRYDITMKKLFLGQMAETQRILRRTSSINAKQCFEFLKSLNLQEQNFELVDSTVGFGGFSIKNPKPCN